MDLATDPAMDLCIGLEHEGLELSSRNGMLWRFLPLLDQLVDVSNRSYQVLWNLCKNKTITVLREKFRTTFLKANGTPLRTD